MAADELPPRSLFGSPIKDLGWTCENGDRFNPDILIPVIETVTNQVIGINPDGNALIVRTFDPKINPDKAWNFATHVWGRYDSWVKPEEHLVECLGDVCCGETTIDFGNNWLLEPPDESGTLRAAHVIAATEDDPGIVVGEHIIYQSFYPAGELQDNDILLRQIELFGPPYDIVSNIVYPPYKNIYRLD